MKQAPIPILLLFVIFSCPAYSQPGEINSLQQKINIQRQNTGYEKDTAYILNIAQLAHLYYSVNADSIFYYSNLALKLSRQINYTRGMSEGYRQLGNANMLAGDIPQALSYYQQSMAEAAKIHDKTLICYATSNIGLIYLGMKKYEEALGYNLRSYNLAKELNDSLRIVGELNNLAEIYEGLGKFDTAFNYQRTSLQMARDLKNEYYETYLSNDLGDMLSRRGRYAEAMPYFRSAAKYYQKTGDNLGLTNANISIAKLFLAQQKTDSAVTYSLLSLQYARGLNSKQSMADAAGLLADIYERTGNTHAALEYMHLHTKYADSLFSEETQKRLYELQVKNKYEREEAMLKEEQAKKDLDNKQKLQSQQLQIVIATLVILTLFVIVMVLLKSRADKQKNNQVLRRMNAEILQQKEELEIQASKLERVNAQKDKLFSTLAHDLRSPFTSLQSVLTLLREGNLPEGQEKAIFAKLNDGVDYAVNLVTNLLNWSSGQIKGINVKPVELNIYAVVADSIKGIEESAAAKGIAVYNQTPAEIMVLADADMVYAILRNLLSNAVKYCSANETITITAIINNGMAEIAVTDTGTGINADVLQKINKGESVTTFGTSKEKGTGLGLLLCKDFAERNGGRLWVKSQPNAGSSFYVSLKTPA